MFCLCSFNHFFKAYEVMKWETNNYNTHISKYLKKLRQSDNRIWSFNSI